MGVEFIHPDYKKNEEDWQKVLDATSGQKAVKAEGDRYLHRPLKCSDEKFKLLLKLAVYTNIVGYTADTLVGAAFRKAPQHNLLDIPDLEYLVSDADGNGLSITQLAQPVLKNILKIGREGLLVDFPAVDGPYSKADLRRNHYRASIKRYSAHSITNWQTRTVGGKQLLSLVTLVEYIQKFTDEFSFEPVKQYRVLTLDEAGFYIQKIYDADNRLVSVNENIRTAKGERLTYIPFVFVGANNNDASVDKSPMLDLAELNLAMYNNAAEVESMAYYCGQPFMTYYPGKADNETLAKRMSAQTIELGASKAHELGENYKVDFNQITPHNLPHDLAKDKLMQMIQTGAKLITDNTAVKTATQQHAENSATTAILSMCVHNTSDAIKQAIYFCAHFNGMDVENLEVEYDINTDFFDKDLDPQVISAQIILMDNGIVSRKDIVDYLKKANMISQSRTIEEIDQDIREDRENAGI
ncbi:DUF4055 domain-containing protein [Pseudoalteromonas sp. GABNS16G]|uniref:DUF4055 domain-containing protein n=1 Tax=unclassified Pseudoalteromonas TaxID=194690 RepID=UPI0023582685|nr:MULTISPECIES: DUF4055 domain-containing protein [unclassified Pseudoalteromonas]MDC9602918.1 DUF4055 domain-containing protein [Pseudoalteromonas sp. GABNS16G]MDC9611527.1 DUF4055 domain-containing protein [Pseudoalteromonas sp. GABNS16H]